MGELKKVRVQLLDPATGKYMEDVDILTCASAIKFGDKQTLQQKFDSGVLQGNTGERGGRWYSGVNITGNSTSATVFTNSGINSAIVGDYYLNNSTSNVYSCVLGGNASTAKWIYESSLKGQKGDTGATGAQGPKGDKGDTGAQGAKGDTGAKGLDGAKGATGAQGPKGDKGDIGATGVKGDKGVSLVIRGNWVSGTSYVNNSTQVDIVTLDGSSYACVKSNNSINPTNTEYWICIARKGDTGAKGIDGARGAIGAQGPKGDTGAKGLDGAKGATGATGSQGPKGDKGDTGAKGLDGANVRVGTSYDTATEIKIFLKEV